MDEENIKKDNNNNNYYYYKSFLQPRTFFKQAKTIFEKFLNRSSNSRTVLDECKTYPELIEKQSKIYRKAKEENKVFQIEEYIKTPYTAKMQNTIPITNFYL